MNEYISDSWLIALAATFVALIALGIIKQVRDDIRTRKENKDYYTAVARSILEEAATEAIRLPPTMITEYVRSICGIPDARKIWARIRINNRSIAITIETDWSYGMTEVHIVDIVATVFREEGCNPGFRNSAPQPSAEEFCTPSNRFM